MNKDWSKSSNSINLGHDSNVVGMRYPNLAKITMSSFDVRFPFMESKFQFWKGFRVNNVSLVGVEVISPKHNT
jgi:hypothetical protein